MTDFDTLIQKLEWGANQKDWSTDLTPAECAEVLRIVENVGNALPTRKVGAKGSQSGKRAVTRRKRPENGLSGDSGRE